MKVKIKTKLERHQPVLNNQIKHTDSNLKFDFVNQTQIFIDKWASVINSYFKELNVEKFNYIDKQLLSFYLEWLVRYEIEDKHCEDATINIHNFKLLVIEYVNSPEMNFKILNKVYNPLLKRERYEVVKDGEIIIIDELYNNDNSFLIDLYPLEFLEEIGMIQYVRDSKLNIILNDDLYI